MSKILRRPMFRGGGTVSSYGNGITAPLVPGYQMGGSINTPRRGLVSLPGGYAGLLDNDFNYINSGISAGKVPDSAIGANVVAKAANKFSTTLPGTVNLKEENEENNNDIILKSDNLITSKLEQDQKDFIEKNIENDQIPKGNIDGLDYLDFTNKDLGVDENTILPGEEIIVIDGVKIQKKNTKLVPVNPNDTMGPVKRVIDQSKVPSDVQDANKNMKSFPADAAEMGADSEIDEIINNPNNEDNTLATTEVSAKDAIRENQELFKELLGSKKARGQDISDMLLRFSGSQGNTVGEKFQNYTRAESAAGPGRGEKINQTAAALAINDYVAGKRSLEQIDKLKEVERFKNDEAMSRVNITSEDSFRDALNKKAVALKAGTTSSSKVVGETIKDILNIRNDSTPVITVGKTYKDLDDINKKIDKIKVGINIIVLKDGRTIVVEKESENSTSVVETPFKV